MSAKQQLRAAIEEIPESSTLEEAFKRLYQAFKLKQLRAEAGATMGGEPVPLEADAAGVLRIGGTRVTLDTVVAAFEKGATAEEIVQRYPVLRLSDVYAVIGYYLRHQPEIQSYLTRRQQEAAVVRQENQRRFDPQGIRDRLLARRQQPG